jgi:hypothetical protein
MQTCSFNDFIQVLKPWLDSYYIRKGFVDANGNFKLYFNDGGRKAFRIDDCSEARLKEIFDIMAQNGIPVERQE